MGGEWAVDLSEVIARAISLTYGLAVAGGLFGFVAYRSSWRWRRLAKAYATQEDMPAAKQWMQTVVLHGSGIAFNNYRGTVTVGVGHGGLMLRALGPVPSPFHAPLLIPFQDIAFTKRNWFLNRGVWEITTRQVPDVRLIIHSRTRDWIDAQAVAGTSRRHPAPPKRATSATWPN